MALANVCNPYHVTGDVSFRANGAVTGKRFVKALANRTGGPGLSTDPENLWEIGHATANGPAAGVARYDVADNEAGSLIGVPGAVVPVTADGAIAAGAQVVVGTAGKAKTYSGAAPDNGAGDQVIPVVVGVAMSGVADGEDCPVKLA